MANIEKTLVLVKPDGVKKHICGEVISRFERKGLSIHAIKMIQVPVELAEEHYAEHKGKGDFATSIDENVVHASDAVETAEREIGLWFPELSK